LRAAIAVAGPLAAVSIAVVLSLYADRDSNRHDAAVIAQLLYLALPALGAFAVAWVARSQRVVVAVLLAAAITTAYAGYVVWFATTIPDRSGVRPDQLTALVQVARSWWFFLGMLFGSLAVSFLAGGRLIAERSGWLGVVAGGSLATAMGFAGFWVAALVASGANGGVYAIVFLAVALIAWALRGRSRRIAPVVAILALLVASYWLFSSGPSTR
jgi:hypothetical protein